MKSHGVVCENVFVFMFMFVVWVCLSIVIATNLFSTLGCKHTSIVKWTKTSAPLYEGRGFLGQTPIVVAKCCLKLIIFHDDHYFLS